MKDYRLALLLIGLVVIVILGSGIYIYSEKNTATSVQEINIKKVKKTKNKDLVPASATNAACVGGRLVETASWSMPDELFEISSIAWLGKDKIAAVQDQKGIIYVYDLASKKVVKRINFGNDGDYEGIAFAGGHFFVMRSDGYMFEVEQSGKVLKEYDLPLTAKDNTEPFYYDAAKNRMLIGQKDGEKGLASKSFFAFDLTTKKFNPKPVYSIDLKDNIVSCGSVTAVDPGKGKKSGKKKNSKGNANIRPSEIVIDPKSGNILVADGPGQRILVLSPEGKPKYYLSMDKNSFPQVEGMLFTPSGEFYISTEGAKGQAAKISKVRVELY
ncbi:hypothetical protein [Pedobacter psychrodurus]|uniref:hypothetical protein n=1 Tax=Pedobacter psychrodurus TaxID=2530456 RepID=UPI002930B4BB|nr:hypothetical protein [Pedobacter psychrodurus]